MKNLLALLKARAILRQKKRVYVNILFELELSVQNGLNGGEEIWTGIHHEYYDRKLGEVLDAMDENTAAIGRIIFAALPRRAA